jgi:hypothetical protein
MRIKNLGAVMSIVENLQDQLRNTILMSTSNSSVESDARAAENKLSQEMGASIIQEELAGTVEKKDHIVSYSESVEKLELQRRQHDPLLQFPLTLEQVDREKSQEVEKTLFLKRLEQEKIEGEYYENSEEKSSSDYFFVPNKNNDNINVNDGKLINEIDESRKRQVNAYRNEGDRELNELLAKLATQENPDKATKKETSTDSARNYVSNIERSAHDAGLLRMAILNVRCENDCDSTSLSRSNKKFSEIVVDLDMGKSKNSCSAESEPGL